MTEFAEKLKEEAELYQVIYSRQLDNLESVLDGRRILVSGAGDSYAASLTGVALSGYEGETVDPRELSNYPKGSGITVIAVSLGGKTRSLVNSVSIHKHNGSKIIVVTGNLESPLAKLGDKIVEVVHPSYILGSGFGSYVSMTAAIAGLLGVDEKPAYNSQCRPKNITMATPFFIGETWSYGVAYFAMLKAHEDLGWPSRSERLEQFMHATVFSLKDYETPVILYPRDKLPRKFLSVLMKKSNPLFLEDLIEPETGNTAGILICTIQSITRLIAEYISKEGLKEPYYRMTRSEAEDLARTIYT
ncbi:MAG: SIS domain-containing protein [Desulfurococcales archaeon]|nr:SIS domain-containing protein [Desulfurococcales archaeon]